MEKGGTISTVLSYPRLSFGIMLQPGLRFNMTPVFWGTGIFPLPFLWEIRYW